MMSFVKSPEGLNDLNRVISDFFAQEADEEMQKMGQDGTLDDEKIELFR